MQFYCHSLSSYKRLKTREVRIGDLLLGADHPIRLQTMTTTDTMDTEATVAEAIRCIEAGAELIRITAPSKKEAENLAQIKKALRAKGYNTPLVADIHFTPNAAEIAAKIVEKVRVNPGNYVDKKKFEQIDYTDEAYNDELERIRVRFTPLVRICKEHGTAMRIGTNHGSLGDRIMSRYGDTTMGMVESAMEFLRICRGENYHNIVLSMKASNTHVMVEAYRLLIQQMNAEFGELYPLHLGVTEAGDGEDGRIKSAVGIGTLLEDGIGDTVRVSLTEDAELEIPVCYDLVKRYDLSLQHTSEILGKEPGFPVPEIITDHLPYTPFEYKRRDTIEISNIGGSHVPVVIADLSKLNHITPGDLLQVGYQYNEKLDKWFIGDRAADYIFIGYQNIDFQLPGTLRAIVYPPAFDLQEHKEQFCPLFDIPTYMAGTDQKGQVNFVHIAVYQDMPFLTEEQLCLLAADPTVVLVLDSNRKNAMQAVRRFIVELEQQKIKNPVIISVSSSWDTADEHLIHFSTEAGGLLVDGMGDGVFFHLKTASYKALAGNFQAAAGRNYQQNTNVEQFLNATAFSILQASRTRISKTEYISCPSCGRTLFDLQETTAKIRAVTNHLKGVKIAIMGCIVNGPGEMADADFGYVGSGVGKITLYKGKEVVKRNIDSEIAVGELINLLKEGGVWVEPALDEKR
ncbi:(E)-4-hydroxy-3-methylbut-2-enyl-diphosphate synthase [Arachidicoccus terrestris]|uniref:(E)-4-hydroxy-3-methylbut-2-enyl-diphosphate synthase n=1 Tax=Arachidicoccus terrestris TaxID=2875539 RepID=UPI001CC3774A|nr:(E)-4-hydroxy-3-methylbut-2-enyl-diphosphate synthase [Arachidicoccus terrestris]UAY54934.1 (E)-4-hydroxy-3-methylbut-2-enyl-diphosphate synthase [Arachidicoccus terrestris]